MRILSRKPRARARPRAARYDVFNVESHMKPLRWCLTLVGAWGTLAVSSAAQTSQAGAAGRIMTVLGPLDPERSGHTLMHEHVFIDFTLPDNEPERWRLAGRTKPVGATAVGMYNAPLTLDILSAVMLGAPNRDNYLLNDERTAIAELGELKRRGGSTLVDVTSIGLKRNPRGLQQVSRATGVNIVMGSSWYVAGWRPSGLESRSIESLTGEIVRDVTIGVDDTDVRAGIIGEVGTSNDPDEPVENRILRASARASRLTGAAVTVHSLGMFKRHIRILDILQAEGADLRRVVLGHSDFLAGDAGYIRPLLDRGATIEFDLLGRPPLVTRTRPLDSEVAKTIADLVKAGYADRIVLSQDICTKTSLKAYGGTGYSFIEESFLPYLKRQGVTDAQINTIIVENPRRLLTLAAPQAALPAPGPGR